MPPRRQAIRLLPLLAGLLLAGLLLSLAPILAAGGPPVLIGGTVSLSGKYSEPSLMVREAVRLWERQTNQAGGVAGRPVRVILQDDASDPERVRQLYQKLIDEDKADLLLAPYSTALTLAALEVSEPRRRLMVGYAASGEEIWTRGNTHVFGVYTSAERYFLGFLDLIARQGLANVAIVHEDSSFPADTARGARNWAARLGLKVVLSAAYRDGQTEFPDLLARAREGGAQALVLGAYTEDCQRLLREMQRQNWRPAAVAMSIGPAQSNFAEQAGGLAEGVFGPSQWEPNLRIPFPGTAKFIADFTAQTGRAPTYHAASAYAGLSIAAKAVEQTGSLASDRLKEYIWGLDTVTIMGRFKLEASGRQIGHSPLLIQWQGMNKEIVYPPRMRTAPPKF
jgi:branched-chain amino acid transport system substrate-binding protein